MNVLAGRNRLALGHVRSDSAMIWIDNANRGTGGADQIGTGTFGGQKWTLLQYHGG